MMYDVAIEQLDLMAVFDLKGSVDDLSKWCGSELPDFPDKPMSYTAKDGLELLHVGWDNWLLRAPLEKEDMLTQALRPADAPDDISIVRVSDVYTFFSVQGPENDEVMAVATSLDVQDNAFTANSAAFSEVYSTKALVMRVGDAYHVGVDRSFGPMIADYFGRTIAD